MAMQNGRAHGCLPKTTHSKVTRRVQNAWRPLSGSVDYPRSGKTILSAKLTIRRILPTGRSGGIKVIGYYGALSNVAGSGAPSSRVSIGTLGLLELPQTGTFDIPPAAISYLAGDSTGRCLALNPKDSALWNGEPYSENHARFAGVGSAYVPELEVTYTP